MTELLSKNNLAAPSNVSQEKTAGGKRTQTLIDEYKAKMQKAQSESEKKTAELLAKSKKIAELQSQMKRDEAVLKKAIEEANNLKRQAKKQATATFDSSSARANRDARKSGKPPPTAQGMAVPDAEEIKNQFMDKLTSKLENFFVVDDPSPSGAGEGASGPGATDGPSLIDTSKDGEDADQEGSKEGNQIVA